MSVPEISHVVDDFKSAGKNPDHDYSRVYSELRDLQTSGKSQDEIKSYYKDLNTSLQAAGILPGTEIVGADNNQIQVNNNGVSEKRDLHFNPTEPGTSIAQSVTAPPANIDSDTKLYGGSNWKDTINANAVTQGKYGDCYFMSSLASVANTDNGKQSIHDMVSVNDDGSYTVRFPGDKDHPVNVTEDDIKNSGVSNLSKWANVAESAFLKYTNAVGGPQVESIDLLARVQNTRQALDLLSGNSSVQTDNFSATDVGDQQLDVGATSKDNVRADLDDAFQNGRPVVATAAAKMLSTVIGEHSADPTQDGHAYSVVGWDSKTQTVTVRNPWGQQNPDLTPADGQDSRTVDGITAKKDGTMTMSLDTFYSHFNTLNEGGKDDNVTHLENTVDQGKDDVVQLALGAATNNRSQVMGAAQDLAEQQTNALNEGTYTASHWAWEKAKDLGSINDDINQTVGNSVSTVGEDLGGLKDTVVGWL